MNKMEGKSLDLEKLNIEKIKELFPNVVTEGKVDFDKLRIILGDQIDDRVEKYQFTWNGKSATIKLAQSPSTGTLIPSKEDSKNWDTTGNLYIEGDNLEVLKQLQKTYYGKVKMIYIDPPYNTGGDFVYKDDFKDNIKNYKEQTQQTGRANPETNGRYHTKWLNMMYPRLILGKNLLSNEGIIFISIDDNEQTNMKKICDEVFGESNFIAQIIVEGTPKNDPLIISTAHEYCLVYVKNYEKAKNQSWGIKNPIYDELLSIYNSDKDYSIVMKNLKKFYASNDLTNDNISNYKFADENGIFRIGPIDDPQRGGSKDTRYNPVTGEALRTPNSGWRCNIDTWNKWIDENLIMFPEDNTMLCSKKTYISNDKLDLLRSYFKIQTRKDTQMLENMFGSKVFSFPKPVDLVKLFIESSTNNDDIILDFFAGSATTAHAVMKLNSEDGKQRKFIMVQLPESLEDNLKTASSNREKATLKNAIRFCSKNGLLKVLTEISKERIRRAGEQIKQELIEKKSKAGLLDDNIVDPETFDNGFKVFKLNSTNINPWDGTIKLNEETIFSQTEVIKEDRSNLDVLYEIMLKYGVFDKPAKEIKVNTKTMYSVADGYLIVCLDNNITLEDVKEIGKLKPRNVIFKESGFANDNDKINATYTLEKLGVEEIKSI